MLLADDAVVGIFGADRRADEGLDVAVAVGDQILVALAFDGQRIEGAEIGEAEFAGANASSLAKRMRASLSSVMMSPGGVGACC